MPSSRVRIDLAEVRRRLTARDHCRARRHTAEVARIALAARLPQVPAQALHGALTSREAASLAGETASTTTTRSGGHDGCST